MARCVTREIVLRYLNDLERTGIGTIYFNNAPLSIAEARQRLTQISRAYIHRGMVYVP